VAAAPKPAEIPEPIIFVVLEVLPALTSSAVPAAFSK